MNDHEMDGKVDAVRLREGATAPQREIIRVENIHKSFRQRDTAGRAGSEASLIALAGISFDVSEGQFVSLLGASGCGKTTLLRIIAGLTKPDSGMITVGGQQVEAPRRDLCMVFQNFGLLPWRTVLDNVVFPLELDGIGKKQREDIANHYIETVGLTGFARHFPHELSGGMQQRVGIARALVRKPVLLLMDEPFAALDAQTREALQEDFLRIWKQLKTTVVLVTHSIDEAVVLSDQIIVMASRPGRVKRLIQSTLGDRRTDSDVRSLPEFAAYSKEIRELLRVERQP